MGQYGPDRLHEELERAEKFLFRSAGERELINLLKSLDHKVDILMSEVDDLNGAVDNMASAVAAAVAEITSVVGQIGNGDDKAAMEAAVGRLNTLAANLTAAIPAPVVAGNDTLSAADQPALTDASAPGGAGGPAKS